jgi:hypothetical protein
MKRERRAKTNETGSRGASRHSSRRSASAFMSTATNAYMGPLTRGAKRETCLQVGCAGECTTCKRGRYGDASATSTAASASRGRTRAEAGHCLPFSLQSHPAAKIRESASPVIDKHSVLSTQYSALSAQLSDVGHCCCAATRADASMITMAVRTSLAAYKTYFKKLIGTSGPSFKTMEPRSMSQEALASLSGLLNAAHFFMHCRWMKDFAA